MKVKGLPASALFQPVALEIEIEWAERVRGKKGQRAVWAMTVAAIDSCR